MAAELVCWWNADNWWDRQQFRPNHASFAYRSFLGTEYITVYYYSDHFVCPIFRGGCRLKASLNYENAFGETLIEVLWNKSGTARVWRSCSTVSTTINVTDYRRLGALSLIAKCAIMIAAQNIFGTFSTGKSVSINFFKDFKSINFPLISRKKFSYKFCGIKFFIELYEWIPRA